MTAKTATNTTVQTMSMNQCNHCCSCAIWVTAGGKFNWLTAGPPGKSFTACADVNAADSPQVPPANINEVTQLKTLFIVLTSLLLRMFLCCAYRLSAAFHKLGGFDPG
jgi:hypothetical protein